MSAELDYTMTDAFLSTDPLPGSPEWIRRQELGHSNGILKAPLALADNGLHGKDLADVVVKPPTPDLIRDIVPGRFPSMFYGAKSQLKSWLVLYAMLCVVSGEPFLDRDVVQSPVIFLDWELDEDTTRHRAGRIAMGMGLPGIPRGLIYHDVSRPLLVLEDALHDEIEERGAGWVTLDSLGLAVATDTQKEEGIIRAMGALRGLGIASTAIDHQARLQPGQEYTDKEAYGSVYKGNLVRGSWQIHAAKSQGLDRNVRDLVMRQEKWSVGPESGEFGIRVEFGPDRESPVIFSAIDVADSAVLSALTLPLKEKLIQAVNDEPGSNAQELADLVHAPYKTVQNALTELTRIARIIHVRGREHQPGTYQPIFYKEPNPGRDSGRDSA